MYYDPANINLLGKQIQNLSFMNMPNQYKFIIDFSYLPSTVLHITDVQERQQNS